MTDSWRKPNENSDIECIRCGCPAALRESFLDLWECPNCGNGFVTVRGLGSKRP